MVSRPRVGEELAKTLDAGDLPDLAALQTLFAPDPARLPTVHVQLASLNGYEALDDIVVEESHRAGAEA